MYSHPNILVSTILREYKTGRKHALENTGSPSPDLKPQFRPVSGMYSRDDGSAQVCFANIRHIPLELDKRPYKLQGI